MSHELFVKLLAGEVTAVSCNPKTQQITHIRLEMHASLGTMASIEQWEIRFEYPEPTLPDIEVSRSEYSYPGNSPRPQISIGRII